MEKCIICKQYISTEFVCVSGDYLHKKVCHPYYLRKKREKEYDDLQEYQSSELKALSDLRGKDQNLK